MEPKNNLDTLGQGTLVVLAGDGLGRHATKEPAEATVKLSAENLDEAAAIEIEKEDVTTAESKAGFVDTGKATGW